MSPSSVVRAPLWRSPLAMRIYLIGLVQFVVVAAGMEVNRVAQTRAMPAPFMMPAHYVVEDVARAAADPARLAHEVERAHANFGWDIVVTDPGGKELARAGNALPTANEDRMRSALPLPLPDGDEGRFEFAVRPRMRPGPGFAIPIALILLVVGVTSLLLASSLARPLVDLTSVARAFGDGKLDARARMNRRDELGEMGRAFDEMADRIQRLLRAERELLANVSHELRTPLARIRFALELASEADPREAVAELAAIEDDLAELERIVDDVLSTARLALEEAPRSGPNLLVRRERIRAHDLLEKAATRFRFAHPRRELRVRFEDDLPDIDGDVVLLRRVVDNLLENAHKYTEAPSEAIDLEARTERGDLAIEVRDRGIGVAEEDLERLFEPFFRVDRSRARSTGGLGLGLPLARRIVEGHGGSIRLSSELGVGTVVTVTLPGRDAQRNSIATSA